MDVLGRVLTPKMKLKQHQSFSLVVWSAVHFSWTRSQMDRHFVPLLLKESHRISKIMQSNQSLWNSGYLSIMSNTRQQWRTIKYFFTSKRKKTTVQSQPGDSVRLLETKAHAIVLWIPVERRNGVGEWGVDHRTPCGHCSRVAIYLCYIRLPEWTPESRWMESIQDDCRTWENPAEKIQSGKNLVIHTRNGSTKWNDSTNLEMNGATARIPSFFRLKATLGTLSHQMVIRQ